MTKFVQIAAVLMLLSAGGCAAGHNSPIYTAQVYNPVDAVQEYTQRVDAVTLSAGNAQQVNSRIHVIDPWPRYVGDTRIAANGERMVNAIYRYRCGKAEPATLPTLSTSQLTSGLTASAVASVGGVRPGSECAGAQIQGQVSGRVQ